MGGKREIRTSFSTMDIPYSLGDDDAASTDGSTSTWSSSKVKEVSNGQTTFSFGREGRAVQLWRAAVIVSLFLITASISVAMWFLLSEHQESTYNAAFAVVTQTIESSSTEQVLKLHESLQALSETYTATAIAENLTWPFVSVTREPIEVLGHQARLQSGVEFIMIAPFVREAERRQWIEYSIKNGWWYDQSKVIYDMLSNSPEPRTYAEGGMAQELISVLGLSPVLNDTMKHCPIWQTSPPPYIPQAINYDLLGVEWYVPMVPALERLRTGLFSNIFDVSQGSGLGGTAEDHLKYHQAFSSVPITINETNTRPHCVFNVPIFEAYQNPESEMVGLVSSVLAWDGYMVNLVPDSVTGIMVVLKNTCNQSFTFMLNGTRAQYLGTGDFLNLTFQESRYNISLALMNQSESETGDWTKPGHCIYSLQVYSTQEFKSSTTDDTAFIFTLLSAGVGLLVIVTFLLYDCFVRRRNAKMVDAAARRDQILTSLFPTTVRTRLLEEQKNSPKKSAGSGGGMVQHRLRSFLSGAEGKGGGDEKPISGKNIDGCEGKPIADLFPEATVLCADISGFTAWASIRQPSQVFTLLESIYKEFDAMANKRKVFKVETVGDCYVAVAGLPDPRKDHAVVMSRFANDCMSKMIKLVEVLEVALGPDTADLSLRVGIHSGPVTAGVLRGERSRFQLFGETMNMASRMESTGVKGRIQCSQDTADLLIAAGKDRWLEPRRDFVNAKGGMQTYWLNTSAGADVGGDFDMIGGAQLPLDKGRRLINWNVDNLLLLLKQIAAARQRKSSKRAAPAIDEKKVLTQQTGPGKSVIDEVKEIINLPDYNERKKSEKGTSDAAVVLPQVVVDQLRNYVTQIAESYNANPFHNFEHASHVAMAVSKLLSRIVAPADLDPDDSAAELGKALHDHTYGITSDPLTQFACVFSALIHDVDHMGVPNAQLVKEKADVALLYKNQSVAEQNSVDLAWSMLMQPGYSDLRRAIYATEAEMRRFRQLVVNTVMATDIVDQNLKALRNARWAKAFIDDADDEAGTVGGGESEANRTNRKATIVIEHVIQAADVSHTMQHWHVYRKWNERFFEECYKAYIEERAETDPSVGWYKGELGFYDFYIIPLAKKLKDCGVFGVSSDECLNYAVRNRKEWEEKGQSIVSEMVERIRQQYPFVTKQVEL